MLARVLIGPATGLPTRSLRVGVTAESSIVESPAAKSKKHFFVNDSPD